MNQRASKRRARRACGACWFEWAVWGAMLLAALAFVWKFGSNVPYWDEWQMVPRLTGEQPVDAGWLWASHSGHRIPFPKLLLVTAYKVTGSDFRVGMYANVLALGAVALAMIRAAKGLRGSSHPARIERRRDVSGSKESRMTRISSSLWTHPSSSMAFASRIVAG
jgi:hypothetical protein